MRIEEMTPEALGDFIQKKRETDYLLVDVRQPHEYEMAHIPGARLLPLPQLFQSLDRLPGDKDLVFYCHSGSRSMVAASMADEEAVTLGTIYNLEGGMLTWKGGVASDQPRVQLFTQLTSPAQMMETAMNLEKGALRFYEQAAAQFGAHVWSNVFAMLAKAEMVHAKTVYHFWQQIDPTDSTEKGFESVFTELPGDVLEGGMDLDAALRYISGIEDMACIRLMELALQIEYAAFDLYRTMADRITTQGCQTAFLSLAQAEKGHIRTLVMALDTCPG